MIKGERPGWKPHYEDMHDFVLFMANTGLRPDEALALEVRDINVERDYGTSETILVIDVRGKTGTGYCKSTNGAVYPFKRLRARRLAALKLANPELDAEKMSVLLSRTKVFLTMTGLCSIRFSKRKDCASIGTDDAAPLIHSAIPTFPCA